MKTSEKLSTVFEVLRPHTKGYVIMMNLFIEAIDEVRELESKAENLPISDVSVSDIRSFISWKEKQNREYIGGKLIYDINGYYKRLKENELFDYWLERVYSY